MSLATASAYASAAATWIASSSVAAMAARAALYIGISKLIAKRADSVPSAQSANGRVQTPPATNNVLPMVYGTAFVAPSVTDAKLSANQQTMWYVCALAEVGTGTDYTFGDIYYDGKLVEFDVTDTTRVVKLITNSDPVQEDDKVDGKLFIYLYKNGVASGVNTALNAVDVMSSTDLNISDRWNGPLYTYTEGSTSYSPQMANTAFAIVKVIYNENAGTTNLGSLNVQMTNAITKPGDAVLDYLTNTTYGCAIPVANVDTASLTDLNTYSDELIDYIDIDGNPATQPRYRVNGLLDPVNNCLTNLQQLVDNCDSWLQYSELNGQWKVVINKAYTQSPDPLVLGDLFLVDSSNLTSGIDVNPIDLNSVYNQVEVQYPNVNINDQYDYQLIDLVDYFPELMSPNEAVNKLQIQLPQVNNAIQAKYLGIRRLLQGREDLTITFETDYSGIQVEAGDIIRVTLEQYDWTEKLFRVSNVQEQKFQNTSLGAVITAFEYNNTIYTDNPLEDYIPEANTGVTDPNIITRPGTPTIATNPLTDGNVKSFSVTSEVSSSGTVLYLDFSYGSSSDVTTHRLYSTKSNADGSALTNNASITISVSDLPPATYYWSTTARNSTTGKQSLSSASFVWGGPGVTVYDPVTNTGGVATNNIQNSAINAAKIATAAVIASKILDGVVSLVKLAPNTGGYLFKDLYTVFNSGGPQDIPVPAGTGVRNVPITISGTNPGSSYIWPWYQGTSSSSDGYGTTSTGPYEPYDAALIDLWADSGDYDWYELFYQSFSSNPFSTNEYITINVSIQIFSDTADTEIQIAPLPYFTGGVPIIQTQQMQSYTITQAEPHVQTISTSYWTPTGTSVEALGFAIRNLTSGSTVTITSCWWSMAQYKE